MQTKNKLSIIIIAFGFMGKYSVESFKKNNFFEIKGIVTPGKNKFYSSSLDYKKLKNKIKILNSDNKSKVYNFIKRIKPDVVLISTFNKIFEKKILNLSKFINIHHGRLPKQKGRASINWAILMGRNSIYLTVHQVIPKLDSGKIIISKKFTIRKKDNYQTLKLKMGNFLKKNISNIVINYLREYYTLSNYNSKFNTF